MASTANHIATAPSGVPGRSAAACLERFRSVRGWTSRLAAPLTPEDQMVQPMADASPTKWHLAHTTWFFETFILSPYKSGYTEFHPRYRFLFNSYYNAVGGRPQRDTRGMFSRPGLEEVLAYRRNVEEQLAELLQTRQNAELYSLIELGLHHEQQHQELIVTDIKNVLATNPLRPVYRARPDDAPAAVVPALGWMEFEDGVRSIGHEGTGFCFDNELPRHQVLLRPFRLASRLVSNAEYLEFMEDGGYRRPQLWLSEGWDTVCSQGWEAPLYWERADGQWQVMTLAGMRPVEPSEPVCHISFFEADAYARWAGARLPTEAEWEGVAEGRPVAGNFLEDERFHPAAIGKGVPEQMFGDVWEWTSSPYVGYPGYQPAAGAIGEYNGKFMCNQMVLRGGSCATPRSHIRSSYRNFFPPGARWQFSGVRLAK